MFSLAKSLTSTLAAASLLAIAGAAAAAPADADPLRPGAVIPVEAEAAAKLQAYAPLPEALARGVVIVQFRTEHFRVFPVFGKTALDVSPRIGHLHVTVDGMPGTWAHTSNDPIIVVGLAPGPHRMLLELADPNHGILAAQTVDFVVPPKPGSSSAPDQHKH